MARQGSGNWWDEQGEDTGSGVNQGSGYDDQYTAAIQALYQQYYGRDATDDELRTHLANLVAGRGSMAHIEAGLDADAKAKGLGPYAAKATLSAPEDGNWEAWFRNLVGKNTLTSDELKGMTDQLKSAGVEVLTNSSGVSGKIKLPDGTIVDVIKASGAGGNQLIWLTGDSGTSSSSSSDVGLGELMTPFEKTFSFEDFQQVDPFVAPTMEEVIQTPGYRLQLDEGLKALERKASATGTLRTGGTRKALMGAAEDYAQGAYQTAYGNKLTEHNLASNENLTDWQTNYAKAKEEFDTEYNIFEANQAKRFNRLASVAGLGQTAANQLSASNLGYSSQYGSNSSSLSALLSSLITGAGNASASGTVGASNAWTSMWSQLANNASSAAMWYSLLNNQGKYGAAA